ncbi:kinesin-like protein KIF18A [Clarias gariepinus]
METSAQIKAQVERISTDLRDAFATQKMIRKQNLLDERNLKATQLRKIYDEENFQQQVKFFGKDGAEKVIFLHDQKLTTIKLKHWQKTINSRQWFFQDYENSIHEGEREITLLGEAGQELKKEVQWLRLKLQVADLQQQCEHLKYLFHLQDKEHKLTCKLVHALLAAYHRQCQTLKAAGMPVDADQEKLLGNLVQRYEYDETTLEITEEDECDTSLLPILEFSHL